MSTEELAETCCHVVDVCAQTPAVQNRNEAIFKVSWRMMRKAIHRDGSCWLLAVG